MAAQRVEIGFSGGQVAAVRVSDEQLAELRRALAGSEGWHDLSSTDGEMALDLSQVVFVKVEGSGSSIGFSGA